MRKIFFILFILLVLLEGSATLFADEVDNAIATLKASSSTKKDQEAACVILGQRGGTKAQNALLEYLKTHSNSYEMAKPHDAVLATALVKIGGPPIEAALITYLSNTDSKYNRDTRAKVAAKVLGEMKSSKAVKYLTTALKQRWMDDSFYEYFSQALELIGDRSAGSGLAVALQQSMMHDADSAQTETVRCRVAIIHALGKLGNVNLAKLLVPILRNLDSTVRGAAVEALRALGWSATNDDEKMWVALAAKDWDALAAMGQKAIPALIAALAEEKSVGTARKMLLSLGVPAIASLIDATADIVPGSPQGKAIIATLAAFGAPAYDPLIAALKSPHFYTRYSAINSLGLIKDNRAAPFIAGILAKEGNESFAYNTSAALAQLGSAGAEPLYTLMSGRDEWARFWAAAAFILGNFASEQRLTTIGRSSDDPDIRGACAWVLVRIGNSSSRAVAAEFLGADPAQEAKKPIDTSKNIWLLISMLETTSNSGIADIYLNSNKGMLRDAAKLWVNRRGYQIKRGY